VWQLRFPQLAFSVEARKLIPFNKNENAKGMWKSIFASCHSGSSASRASCACKGQNRQAEEVAEISVPHFCHSERSEESFFLLLSLNPREILRFAPNDKINYFLRSL
jgi:hypothetical protein